MFMKSYIKIFTCIVIVFGCGYTSNSYQIKKDGVFSKKSIITQFSISQFKMDHKILDDIRPNEHTELMRYCFELKDDRKGNKGVLFKTGGSNHRWTLCKLDTTIIANDSLNNLSFGEKLKYIKERDKLRTDSPSNDFPLPFAIQNGYVYQIFGLPNLKGSYYFCLDSDNKLLVQYEDGGPW